MNIDNQLILGIVFITAGIALALLAYAAVLNRQESELEGEAAEEGEAPSAEPAGEAGPGAAELEPPAIPESAPEPPAEDAAEVEPAAPTVASPSAETVSSTPSPVPPAEPTVEAASSEPSVDIGREARLLRDPETKRLMIEVGDSQYRSMEALRISDDWTHVSSLFSDLLAWMVKKEPAAEVAEDQAQRETKSAPDSGKSMIEQINDILRERMAEREDEPAGVRLMAGTDGSIRVFVGLESYSMDEVPDPEVREVIRQAVTEWESRQ